MVREEPFFRKCCWFIPLKTCLQVWSGFKSMVDLGLVGFLVLLVILIFQYEPISRGLHLGHGLIVYIFILVLDSIFMLVLTVGICTNNLRTLRVYFYYSFYMVTVSGLTFVVFLIVGIVSEFIRDYGIEFSIIAVLLIVNFGIDIGIIFTLKSEMIKLRNKQQYGFVKMSSLIQDQEVERIDPEPFQADQEHVGEINN